MPTNIDADISILRTAVVGRVPSAAILVNGQLAANTADQVLFIRDEGGVVRQLGVKPGDIKTVAFTGSYNDLTDKPNISGEYVLPPASSTALGGVIIASPATSGLIVDGSGNLTARVISVNTKTGVITLDKTDVGFPSDFLDGSNQVRVAYLPSSVTAGLQYKGTYDATAHTPALPDAAAGNTSWLYVVNVAGTADFPTQPDITVAIGDWLISNGTSWERVPLVSGNVTSVNGQTGNVTVNATNLPGLSVAGRTGVYSDLTGIPSTFAPSAHTHPATQVTGLATVATTGNYSDLNGLPPDATIAQVGMTVTGDPAVLGEDDYLFVRDATFPDNFANSVCRVTLVSGTTATINILKNSSLIGTIITDTATGTFNTTATGPTLFAPGDALTFQYATTNIAKFTVNLKGNWTS